MVYAPIAGIVPQYSEQPSYWLKFYIPSTSTPISMSIDEDGTTTFAKVQLDIDGFTTTDGETLFIPFLDQSYDAFLFPTEVEADANDTANAKRIAQDINPFADNITTVIKKIKPAITPGQTLIVLDDQPVAVNVIILMFFVIRALPNGYSKIIIARLLATSSFLLLSRSPK